MRDEEKKVEPIVFLPRYSSALHVPQSDPSYAYSVDLLDVSAYRTLRPGEMRIREDPRLQPPAAGEQDPDQSAPPPPENPEA